MGFRKKIESRKAVAMNYFRISSFSYSQTGSLTVRAAGYRDGEAFSAGADPIDEFDVVFHNADTQVKSFFYDLIENHVPLFKGAEKDLSYSAGQQTSPHIITVQTSMGDIIEQTVLDQPESPDALPGSPPSVPAMSCDQETPELLPAETPATE